MGRWMDALTRVEAGTATGREDRETAALVAVLQDPSRWQLEEDPQPLPPVVGGDAASGDDAPPPPHDRDAPPAAGRGGPAGTHARDSRHLDPSPTRSKREVSHGSGDTSATVATPAAAALGVHDRVLALPPVAVITDEVRLRRFLSETARVPLVGFDTETTGLDPHCDRLRLVQVATPEAVYVLDVPALGAAVGLLRDWLPGRALAGHNLSFDLGFLQAAALLPDDPPTVFDTMIAAQILTCAQEPWLLHERGRHTLAAVAARHLGVSLPKEEQAGDWSGELTAAQVEYAARDAVAALGLVAPLTEALAVDGLMATADLENAVLPVIAGMEYDGVGFDVGYAAGLAEDLAREAEAAQAALRQALPGTPALNPNSQPQVLVALAAAGLSVPDTKEETLAKVAAKYPAVRALLAYRGLAKALGIYGPAYAEHVHPATGRIHASWHQLGAATGRMSCSKPNVQQMPHGARFRRCIVPAGGMAFVVADYSQIELRIAAKLANDAALVGAFQAGDDVHTRTAALLTAKAEADVSRDDRQAAKAANFGLLYGSGAKGLRAYAQSAYGVAMTEKQAVAMRRGWRAAYRGIAAWQAQVDGEGRRTRETRTSLGRARRWKPIPRSGWETGCWKLTEALNSPVQGAGADLLKFAMVTLAPALRAIGGRLVLAVHDELVAEVPADRAEEARGLVVAAMEEAGRAMLDPVPCRAEAVVAASWAEKP